MNDQVVATLGIDEVGTSVEGSLQKIGHKVLVKLLGFHCIGVLTKIVQLRLEEVEIGSLNWLFEPGLVERLFRCHLCNCQCGELVELRAIEIERRANDLASELQRLHADLASTKAAAQAERQQHTEQRKQSAQEALRVAERMTQAEADRDQERREAGKAREETARLQGMVQAMTSQNAELMRAVAGGTGAGAGAGAAPAAMPATAMGKKKDQ